MSGFLNSIIVKGVLSMLAPLIIGWIASFLTDGIQFVVPFIKRQNSGVQQVINGMLAALLASAGTALGVSLCPDALQACGLDNVSVNAAAAALFGYAKKHADQIQAIKTAVGLPTAATAGNGK